MKTNKICTGIEYRMSKTMAKEALKTRKGADQNMHPQEWLCKYVNETCGLKGDCVKVTLDL